MEDGDTMKRDALLLCADANYLPAAVFTANRVRDLTPDAAFDVFIYTDAEPDPALRALAAEGVAFRIGDLTVQEWSLQAKGYMSLAIYLRLIALEELGRSHGRILYLDCDLLPRTSIAPLLALDLRGHALAAVRSALFWGVPKRSRRRYAASLGLSDKRKYLNSGVLLLDGAEWTGREIGLKAMAFNRDFPELCRFNDQSAINAVVKGDWLEMSPRWNWSLGPAGSRSLWESWQPHILHFNGKRKPWNDDERVLGEALTGPWLDWAEGHGLSDPAQRTAPLSAAARQVRLEEQMVEAAAVGAFASETRDYLENTPFAL